MTHCQNAGALAALCKSPSGYLRHESEICDAVLERESVLVQHWLEHTVHLPLSLLPSAGENEMQASLTRDRMLEGSSFVT